MTDYSNEVNPARAKWLRTLYLVLGSFFFGLAILGVFLPFLPTTPFLLLTAACYARGSAKFYNWLMNHYILGPYIRDWRSHKGIPKRTKATAAFLIVVTFGISATFIPLIAVRIIFLAVGVGVIAYLWLKVPTKL